VIQFQNIQVGDDINITRPNQSNWKGTQSIRILVVVDVKNLIALNARETRLTYITIKITTATHVFNYYTMYTRQTAVCPNKF